VQKKHKSSEKNELKLVFSICKNLKIGGMGKINQFGKRIFYCDNLTTTLMPSKA